MVSVRTNNFQLDTHQSLTTNTFNTLSKDSVFKKIYQFWWNRNGQTIRTLQHPEGEWNTKPKQLYRTSVSTLYTRARQTHTCSHAVMLFVDMRACIFHHRRALSWLYVRSELTHTHKAVYRNLFILCNCYVATLLLAGGNVYDFRIVLCYTT